MWLSLWVSREHPDAKLEFLESYGIDDAPRVSGFRLVIIQGYRDYRGTFVPTGIYFEKFPGLADRIIRNYYTYDTPYWVEPEYPEDCSEDTDLEEWVRLVQALAFEAHI